MTNKEIRKFIEDWGAGFVMLFGLFLIYKDVAIIGSLIYGACAHVLALVYLVTIYDEGKLKEFIERVNKAKTDSPWIIRKINQLIIIFLTVICLYVLASKGHWYLFSVTGVNVGLMSTLVIMVKKERRGSKVALGG